MSRSISFYGSRLSKYLSLSVLCRIRKSVKTPQRFSEFGRSLQALNFFDVMQSSPSVKCLNNSRVKSHESRVELQILNFSFSVNFKGILCQMDEMNSKLHECDVILGTMSRSSAKDKLIITQETLRRNNALVTGMIVNCNSSCSICP